MITMLDIGLNGRLGNQLFQYASMFGIAKRNGYELRLPSFEGRQWHGQNCMMSNFNLSSGKLDKSKFSHYLQEPSGLEKTAVPYIYSCRDDSAIRGMLQCPSYFDEFREDILREFQVLPSLQKTSLSWLENVRSKGPTVSVHIRRGDNFDGTNPVYEAKEKQLLDYVKKAMSLCPTNSQFVIFCGGSRSGDDSSDIAWARDNFKNCTVSESNDPLFDFSTIINCDISIVSPLSTFSWWAAYLSEGDVIAPSDFLLTDPTPKDFLPEGWNLL
jgi:galactoside 2-L-fucosyltransferase 1/2